MGMGKEGTRSREEATLYLKDVSKTFGGTKALDHVELTIMPGEIHGLLGQNGCGKSTLIKILAGFHEPDKGGKLWIQGAEVELPLAPGEFNKYGMSFVHQDLGLVPTLTVLENLNMNRLAISSAAHINWKKETQRARAIFDKYGIDIAPPQVVSTLGQVQKAMLAIVRAVESIKESLLVTGRKRGLLVLDEPTVFLPKTEVDTLFRLVREVVAEGISVLFVSHDLDEVMALTDTLTILRDGKNVGTLKTADTTKDEVIEKILGKKLEMYSVSGDSAVKETGTKINISGLSGEMIRDVGFEAREGEVLGLTGLVGSGFEEIPYLLFGAADEKGGKLELENETIDLSRFSPTKAVESNIALIPADRPNAGAILDLEIQENTMMTVMDKYRPMRLQKKKIFEKNERLLKKYEVNTENPKLLMGALSGGNQQKVLLAKWLQAHPRLIILHEPTQGVDIGARQQVYRLISRTVKNGATVLCSSSDYEQLEQICDRVLIFVRGRIVKELVGDEITKDRITQYCYESLEA